MWKPNYGENEVSPYYQNETIQNAALPDCFAESIRDYVSSLFLSSKGNVDTLLNDLAKEISAYVNDEEFAEKVLSFAKHNKNE